MTVAALIVLVLLVGLGNWQMRRLAWKLTLIEQVDERAGRTPIPLEEALTRGTPDQINYMPVVVSGSFDHAREVHVFGRNLDGYVGYFIYTPLEREGRFVVIVNRGFVPQNRKDPSTRASGQTAGQVELTGLVRTSSPRRGFQPVENRQTNEWYARDLGAMADHMGETRFAPVFVEAQAGQTPGGIPQGGQTLIVFRNRHLGYALTWYGLAVTLLGVYIAVHVKSGRIAYRRNR